LAFIDSGRIEIALQKQTTHDVHRICESVVPYEEMIKI